MTLADMSVRIARSIIGCQYAHDRRRQPLVGKQCLLVGVLIKRFGQTRLVIGTGYLESAELQQMVGDELGIEELEAAGDEPRREMA